MTAWAPIRLATYLTYLTAEIVLSACSAAGEPLCVNGWPTKRPPDCTVSNVPGCITYGGLALRHGYQRDHWTYPLCLGQEDTAAHVRYQPLPEAFDKDRLERYACKAYCSNIMDLTHARMLFDNWPQSYLDVFGEWPAYAKEGAKTR